MKDVGTEDENLDLDSLQGKLYLAGMSRSGTNWLMRVLNSHPQIAAFGESTYWGRDYKEPAADGFYEPEQIKQIGEVAAERYWAPGDGKPGSLKSALDGSLVQSIKDHFARVPTDRRMTPFEVFRILCQAVAEAEGKRIAVEKTPHHVMWRDRIDEFCPDHKMVITFRDSYGFMLSYKHQGDRQPEAIKKDFKRRYHPFGCAVVWRGYARQVLKAKQTRPDRTLVIDFTELQDNEDQVIDSIQSFYSLAHHPLAGKVPKANSSFPGGLRPNLQPEDVFWMNLIAKSEMDRLGYEKRKTPFAPLQISYSMITCCWWAIGNAIDMKKRVRGSLLKYLYRWLRGN